MVYNNSMNFAKAIRIKTLEMVYHARASHVGGALSMADILAVLFFDILHLNPANPQLASRDRFLLSKGHACTSLYAALGLKGFFSVDELNTYAQDGSIFLSHTSHYIPGVEISAGSLGHALPVSTGLALAAKRKNATWKTYCLVSDGELNEGSNWEAILFSPQHKLDNLILIVDYNKIQSFGNVVDVISLTSLKQKFESFNWEVFEVDGHSHNELHNVFFSCNKANNKPKVVIAHTTKGKGVSFMEGELLWHYKSPDKDQFEQAIKEITSHS